MTAEAIKTGNEYQSAFEALQANNVAEPAWLTRLRQQAIDQFTQTGFPAVTEEEWKYTNVAPIGRGNFVPAGPVGLRPHRDQIASFVYPESEKSRLVFVNGALQPELSSLESLPAGVVALSFAEALNQERFSEVLREYLGRVVDPAENGFTSLNTALAHGVLIFVERNAQLVSPLQLVFLTGVERDEPATFPRLLLLAEANSSATIIETYAALHGGRYLTNAVIEAVLQDGARLEHYRVQNESAEAFHVTTMHAELGRSSSFDSTNITLGAKLSRHNLIVTMNDEGAECWVDGLYIVGDEQHADTHSVIDHKQPRCTSHQLYKGILDGKSRAVFNGKVFVRHGAAGTDAQQTNKNLLLSGEAHVDTKPQLEIFADDVKCAHGAAIGQLSEEELFYLRSRGIHSDLARNLLTYGFAEEVISKIKIASIKAQLDEAVLNRLHARLEA